MQCDLPPWLKGRAGTSDLVRQIDRELKIHTQIEEEIFYPAFKEAVRSKEDRLVAGGR